MRVRKSGSSGCSLLISPRISKRRLNGVGVTDLDTLVNLSSDD
jgi:hypothetical protein